MLDMSLDCYDAEDANLNAVCFGHKKKLRYSGGKCKTMAVNAKKKDKLPSMFIEWEEMETPPLSIWVISFNPMEAMVILG